MPQSNTRTLGDLEQAVLRVMWRKSKEKRSVGSPIRDVVAELAKTRQIAYTTVMTVANRLVEKGLLVRTPAGREYLYTPRYTETEFARSSTRATLADLFRRFGKEVVVTQFLDTTDLKPKVREELLRKLKKQRKPQ